MGGKKKKKASHKAPPPHKGNRSSKPHAASSKTRCKHESTVRAASVVKNMAMFDMCALSMCGVEESLCVCLGCGVALCRKHIKKHWAQAKNDLHCLILRLEEREVTCYSCDLTFGSDTMPMNVVELLETVFGDEKGGKGDESEDEDEGMDETASSTVGAVSTMTQRHATGLSNLGNTCFFNSTLQSMAYLPPFQEAVATHGPVGNALTATIRSMWSGNKRVAPTDLLKLMRSRCAQFRRGTQEDAHELFRSLVDLVDEESKKMSKKTLKDNAMRNVFLLETSSIVTCHACEKSFMRQEEAFDISVEMSSGTAEPRSRSSKGGKNRNVKLMEEEPNSDSDTGKLKEESDDGDAGELKEEETNSDGDAGKGKEEETNSDGDAGKLKEEETESDGDAGKGKEEETNSDGDVDHESAKEAALALTRSKKRIVPTPVRDASSGLFDVRQSTISDGAAASKVCPFLEPFTAPELLTGDNKYLCSHCKTLQPATKQLALGQILPECLVVHFKRFGANGGLHKIMGPVAGGLESELNVARYCIDSKAERTKYRLKSVVIHLGKSLRSGHYIAVAQHNGKCFSISDTAVRNSTEKEMLNSDAYMAFFLREP